MSAREKDIMSKIKTCQQNGINAGEVYIFTGSALGNKLVEPMRALSAKIGLKVHDQEDQTKEYTGNGFIVYFHNKEMTNLISCLVITGRMFDYLIDDAAKQESLVDWVVDQWVSRVTQEIPADNVEKLKEAWDPFLKNVVEQLQTTGGPYIAGQQMTIADFVMLCLLRDKSQNKAVEDFLDQNSLLQQYMYAIEEGSQSSVKRTQ